MATGKRIIVIWLELDFQDYRTFSVFKVQDINEILSNLKSKLTENDSLLQYLDKCESLYYSISSSKEQIKQRMKERTQHLQDYKYLSEHVSKCINELLQNFDFENQIQNRRRCVVFDKEGLNRLFSINSLRGKYLLYQVSQIIAHSRLFKKTDYFRYKHYLETGKISEIANNFLTRRDNQSQQWAYLQRGLYVDQDTLIVSPFCEHIMHREWISIFSPRSCLFYAKPIVT